MGIPPVRGLVRACPWTARTPKPGTHGHIADRGGSQTRLERRMRWSAACTSARAVPLRLAGAALVQDLRPHDRGPRGTHEGAVIANGNLYCPAAPRALLELGPLSRAAAPAQAAQHDARTVEAARCKLGRLTSDDADGCHRVQCPAAAGKVRCPLQPPSMTLDRDRPEILTPPGTRRPAAPGSPSPSRRT
jgi:hypothetical protein